MRDFDIHAGEFFGFYDKYNHLLGDKTKKNYEDESIITDKRLLMIIKTQRSNNHMHDIIASIQANQYQIITQDKAAFLSVCGCAGSGKTMIMFHRLRYLLYNNRDIDIKQTFLISPINLLLQASDELSRTLQIQRANHLTTIQFYQYAIALYKQSRQILGDTRRDILLNDVLDAQAIKILYSCKSCDKFQANMKELFKNRELFDRFIQEETQRVRQLLVDFGCKTGDTLSSLLQDDDFYNRNLPTYEEARNELKSYSLENAKEMKKYEEDYRTSKNTGCFKADYLDYLIQNRLFIGRITKLNHDGTVTKQYSQLDNLRCLFNDKSDKDPSDKDPKKDRKKNLNVWDSSRNQLMEKYSHHGKYRDPLELFAAYKMLHDRVVRLQTFARNHDFSYLDDLISNKTREIKQQLLLDEDITYEWELFYTCLGFHAVCGQIDDEVRYIFLDEFQDFAPVELDCMCRMLPNGVFNLFGDPKQCITPKGIENTQDIPFQTAQYELNENYRNALEITEYVNQEFDMHMLPVGLHGVVRKVHQVSVTRGELESGDRIAVIYKEKAYLARYNITEENPLFSFLDKQGGEFIPQKINVLPIFQAKGLEFEKVFVISEGMNQSEKYVAMTRALNELMILK